MSLTIADLRKKKLEGHKIAMVTAYDYSMARLCDEAGADMILVGDSLGMVMLGLPDTVSVTMDDMVHHSRAVARGTNNAFVLADMPFLSVRTGERDAMINAGRLMAEGRAQGVKMEGGRELCGLVEKLTRAGIPVMGHLGLMPQSVNTAGGYHVQAREALAAKRLVEDAIALDQAGAFGLVLECVPGELARMVSERVSGITIGIGAGPHCDGQVLVLHDFLGLYEEMRPKFVKRFANAGAIMREGIAAYCENVANGSFPDDSHSFAMKPEVVAELERLLSDRS